MRLSSLVVALSVLVPAAASAGPIVVGASLGLAQSKVDAQSDPNHAVGLFGRFSLTGRLAAQLDINRIQADDPTVAMRTETATVILDLGAGSFVPLLLVGAGFDQSSSAYSSNDVTYHHVEVGGGAEYRTPTGLRIGLDVRIGDRTVDSQPVVYNATPPATGGKTPFIAPAPSHLSEGEYRSARLTLGVAF